MSKTKTIAVFGVGPGMGRAVAHRFGREGFQVALVARNQTRLDAFTAELAAEGITAAGFAGDIADRDALPGLIESITARFGPIDVLEYAPSGLDLLNAATAIRDADAAAFEFPLDLLLRTPVTLIGHVLPGMIERGDGAVLFGLPVTASVPVPPFGNLATAGAAARHYLHTLHTDLADTGVYAGVLQISGPVGDSDAGNWVLETYGAANLPEPQKPADLADAMWDLYLKRDRFDQVFGT
jgi:NAD(P)-dependent dehydrogenase (short-subunit alcohol dehydrogenase family)